MIKPYPSLFPPYISSAPHSSPLYDPHTSSGTPSSSPMPLLLCRKDHGSPCSRFSPLPAQAPISGYTPFRIELLALQYRVKDPEIRLWVHARRCAEAPTAIITCKIPINQMFHEEPFAHTPIYQEVLCQEASDGHSCTVVHIPRVEQLAHCGVDERVPGLSRAPFVKKGGVIRPFDIGVFWFKRFIHTHIRPMRQHMFVEIPPGDFGDQPLIPASPPSRSFVVFASRAERTAVRALRVPDAKCTERTAVVFAAGKLRVSL